VVSRLQAMGLNLYESRAYLALLGGKPMSAKQIGQVAMIPQSRTYDVLESLASKGFALGTPSTPKLYTAVPSNGVLPSQYQARKKEIQEAAGKVVKDAQDRLDQLTDAYRSLVEDLKNTERPGELASEPVWVIEGRNNIESTIVSLIQGAKKDIMRITRPPDMRGNYPLDPFYLWKTNWRNVVDAMDRGVRVRYLSLTRELPSYPGLGVSEPPERRFLEHDADIIEKFFIADDGHILLNLYDPKLSAFGSLALLMRSEAACAVFREHFEAMWDRARPLDEVLPNVRAKVSEACERMAELGYSKVEVALYKAVAEMGASSDAEMVSAMRRRKVKEQEVANACSRLEGKSIMHRNKTLKVTMVENPSNVLALLGA
jgi:HTH-type transcriptional regulator, sugar sensing transcriptional regulator